MDAEKVINAVSDTLGVPADSVHAENLRRAFSIANRYRPPMIKATHGVMPPRALAEQAVRLPGPTTSQPKSRRVMYPDTRRKVLVPRELPNDEHVTGQDLADLLFKLVHRGEMKRQTVADACLSLRHILGDDWQSVELLNCNPEAAMDRFVHPRRTKHISGLKRAFRLYAEHEGGAFAKCLAERAAFDYHLTGGPKESLTLGAFIETTAGDDPASTKRASVLRRTLHLALDPLLAPGWQQRSVSNNVDELRRVSPNFFNGTYTRTWRNQRLVKVVEMFLGSELPKPLPFLTKDTSPTIQGLVNGLYDHTLGPGLSARSRANAISGVRCLLLTQSGVSPDTLLRDVDIQTTFALNFEMNKGTLQNYRSGVRTALLAAAEAGWDVPAIDRYRALPALDRSLTDV